MIVLALCVLMLPLLNACAAGQEASGPALTSRAAAAISAAQTAYVAQASAEKAKSQSAKSSGPSTTTTTVAPYSPWQQLIERAKALRSSQDGGQDAFSLPSIWRSIYQNYRELQTSRGPSSQAVVPQ
jgi:hypothetical protein